MRTINTEEEGDDEDFASRLTDGTLNNFFFFFEFFN